MTGKPAVHVENTSAQTGVERVRQLTRDIGIPQGLKDLDIPESAVEDMAKMAMTVARPLANNPRKVTKKDAVEIYKKAF
jgi:alcohol dehydrogenase